MATAYDAILEYFEREGWNYRRLGNHQALEMGVVGENGSYRLVAVVDDERSIVRFLTIIDGKIPDPRIDDVMEYLTRANYGLLLGNFELDLGDGEVRFKCSIDTEETGLSYTQYQNLLYVSVAMMDRYYPGLQKVIQGAAEPLAAILEIEQKG
jgi:hypothetical protein